MWVRTEVTEKSGEPSRSTSVVRRVYSRSGKVLSTNTWYSSYRSEPEVIRYGTKPRPKAPPPPPPKPKNKKPPPPPPPPPPPEEPPPFEPPPP
jgi:hypothetical protein